MQVNFYVVPVKGHDKYRCAEAIKDSQDVEKVTFLLDDDISQALRVPFMQGYKGHAVIITSDRFLQRRIDTSKYVNNNKAIAKTSDNSVIILNAGNSYFFNCYSPKQLVQMDLRKELGAVNSTISIDDGLLEYTEIHEQLRVPGKTPVNTYVDYPVEDVEKYLPGEALESLEEEVDEGSAN